MSNLVRLISSSDGAPETRPLFTSSKGNKPKDKNEKADKEHSKKLKQSPGSVEASVSDPDLTDSATKGISRNKRSSVGLPGMKKSKSLEKTNAVKTSDSAGWAKELKDSGSSGKRDTVPMLRTDAIPQFEPSPPVAVAAAPDDTPARKKRSLGGKSKSDVRPQPQRKSMTFAEPPVQRPALKKRPSFSGMTSDPASQESPPLPPSVQLATLLEFPYTRLLFENYAKKMYCSENLEIYYAMNKYENVETEEERKEIYQQIYENFLADGCPKEFNCHRNMKREIIEKAEKGSFDPTLFEPLKVVAGKQLYHNLYPQFVLTPDYLSFQASLQEKEQSKLDKKKARRSIGSLVFAQTNVVVVNRVPAEVIDPPPPKDSSSATHQRERDRKTISDKEKDKHDHSKDSKDSRDSRESKEREKLSLEKKQEKEVNLVGPSPRTHVERPRNTSPRFKGSKKHVLSREDTSPPAKFLTPPELPQVQERSGELSGNTSNVSTDCNDACTFCQATVYTKVGPANLCSFCSELMVEAISDQLKTEHQQLKAEQQQLLEQRQNQNFHQKQLQAITKQLIDLVSQQSDQFPNKEEVLSKLSITETQIQGLQEL